MSIEEVNETCRSTMAEHLGIRITEVGSEYLKGSMPVDERTRQPAGILHGGASVALAETLGSIGGWLCIDRDQQVCAGLEINANHIRQVRSGEIEGVARPLHVGKQTQVWEIRISQEDGKLVCVSRLTLANLSLQRD